jgi:hypothetical protein
MSPYLRFIKFDFFLKKNYREKDINNNKVIYLICQVLFIG